MKRFLIALMALALTASAIIGLSWGNTSVSAAQSVLTGISQQANQGRGGPGGDKPGKPDGTHAGGVVASVSASTLTVTGRNGASQVIVTTSSTTFTLDGTAANLQAIAAGQFIRAEGTTDSAGTFTATAVQASTTAPTGQPGGPRR